ncbi:MULTISPECIES: hypothetical protein [Phenylobacterium]|uniref:Outer membrane assembly lipoprotein YfiO n=1 Tax=Phenylobacterium koreense TaxID=266125 RepID=A0ABV2EF35_9CAUL
MLGLVFRQAACGLAASLALVSAACFAGPARASGDFGCEPQLSLVPTAVDTQCWNAPFLNPQNDSRTNLQLLLNDAEGIGAPKPPPLTPLDEPWRRRLTRWETPFWLDDFRAAFGDEPDTGSDEFAAGEGSRCRSNDSGMADFQAAVEASRLKEDDKAALIALRRGHGASCGNAPADDSPPEEGKRLGSSLARQFASYSQGAASFYASDFAGAQSHFALARASRNAWLREAATYMQGRVALNAAQANAFGEWGELDRGRVDKASLDEAVRLFEAYLKAYPEGRYAASARGLFRRAAWLGGRNDELSALFAWQFDHLGPNARNTSVQALVQEADAKLLSEADLSGLKEPRLLATADLMRMRIFRDDKGQVVEPMQIRREELEAQRPAFAGREALFDYLLAAHAFYVDNDPAGALKRLGDMAPGAKMGSLEFSRQMLRGLGLEATGNPTAARGQFQRLIPTAEPLMQRPAVELALTMNYERTGDLGMAFLPGSPILSEDYRRQLLTYSASAELLRQQASAADAPETERRTALFVLLYKQLTRGRYKDFLADLKQLPPAAVFADTTNEPYDDPTRRLGLFHWSGTAAGQGYACPSIETVAGALARDARKPEALICLAEFFRKNSLDDSYVDEAPAAGELGGGPSQFPGGAFSRLDVYKQILAEPKATAEVRAYALYRAVNCYAPSGHNACGGADVPLSQRKQWFQDLKTRHSASPWAERLKYYW